jgi:hypothetical protein
MNKKQNNFAFFVFFLHKKMNTIGSELQMSREAALLGSYDTSLIWYESVLHKISMYQ